LLGLVSECRLKTQPIITQQGGIRRYLIDHPANL
jgi:hypothetical protein